MKKRFVRTGPQGRFFLRHAFWMYAWESGLLNGHTSPGAYRVRVHYSRDNKSFSIFTASLTSDMGLIFGMGMVIWSAYPLVTFIRLDGKVCPCGKLNTQGASLVDVSNLGGFVTTCHKPGMVCIYTHIVASRYT